MLWWGLRTSYRNFSTRQIAQEVLVRDWIRSSLYQTNTGYFHPLAFKGMVGESDYRKAVAKVRYCSAFIKLKRKHVQHLNGVALRCCLAGLRRQATCLDDAC
jgi:hypothetical protein